MESRAEGDTGARRGRERGRMKEDGGEELSSEWWGCR
jgi:hypothetical protein